MSCNCGCHDEKPPATGWRKFVPLIVGVVAVGALIAGAVLKKDGAGKNQPTPPVVKSASGPESGR